MVAKTSVLLDSGSHWLLLFLEGQKSKLWKKKTFFEKKWVRSELRNDDGAAGKVMVCIFRYAKSVLQ